MAITFKPKTSSTLGAIPTLAQLADGEIAVNFADGKIFQRVGSAVKAIAESGAVRSLSVNNFVGTLLNFQVYNPTENAVLEVLPVNTAPNTFLAGPYGPDAMPGPPSLRPMHVNDLALPLDYITGLRISTDATSIEVSSGYAVVQGGKLVRHNGSNIGLTNTANTLYHLYLNSGGNIDRYVDLSTSRPSAIIFGTARTRQGTLGNGRRYIGSVRTNSAGEYMRIYSNAGANQVDVQYRHNTNTESVITNNGASDTPADAVAPWLYGPVVTGLFIRAYNNGTNGVVRLYTWDGTGFTIFTNIPLPGSTVMMYISVDDTPKFQYDVQGTTGRSVALAVMGYSYSR